MPVKAVDRPSIPSIRPRVIRLGRPVTQMVYQLSAYLASREGDDCRELITQAARRILDWVQEKFPQEISRRAWDLESVVNDRIPGQKVECVAVPDEGKWAVRLEQPDASILGQPPVAGRFWTTDISLCDDNGRVRLGTRVACASPPDCIEDIFLTRPRFVKDLITTLGIASGILLSEKPYIVGTHFQVDRLVDLLHASERTIPVVVLSERDCESGMEEADPLSGYAIDGDHLAEKLVSYAHVVLMPLHESRLLTKKLGPAWSVSNGDIRTYLPGMNPEKEPDWIHPRTDLERILAWPGEGTAQAGINAFTVSLVRGIQESNTKLKVNWSAHPFVPELKLLENRKKQAEIGRAIQASRSEAARVAQMSRQLEAREEENAMLRAQLEKAEKDADEFSAMAEQYEQDAKYYEGENSNLRTQLHALREQMETDNQEPIDQSIPLPETVADMALWAGRYLTGRLLLHPRAVNALKDCEYEDTEKLARTLLLLANEYRDMKMGKVAQKKFTQCLNSLHLRESPAISRERAGEFNDEYFINYPVGSTKRTFLEHHLRSIANTRDPARCLAVYFLWDDANRQVVVGWLPSHLRCNLT